MYADTRKRRCVNDGGACNAFEFVDAVGRCQRCPLDSVADPLKFERSCIFKLGQEQMVELLSVAPTWADYGMEDAMTLRLKRYWETASMGGGPLMKSLTSFRFSKGLKSVTVASIGVPLPRLMEERNTYGFSIIKRVQFAAESTYFYDIWVLSTNRGDAAALRDLVRDQQKSATAALCCWTTGAEVAKYVNGFARVIHYVSQDHHSATPGSAFQIWEGEVKGGKPFGFSRFTTAASDYSFVGYLKTWSTAQKGTGLFFRKSVLEYSGFYSDGAPVEEKPGIVMDFDEFI